MKENKYEIKFTDQQTNQEYQVGITVNGELTEAIVQRNTWVLLGGGKFDDKNVQISRLEKTAAYTLVPVELKKAKKS